MTSQLLKFSSLSLILTSTMGVVQAQDAGTLQRELQLQLERSNPSTQIEKVRPTEPKEAKPDEQKISVKGFKFAGNTLVTNEQLQEIVKPWINTQITFNDLKYITAAIQDFYSKLGRVALANVPPQEIKDDIILIEIHEGKLGSVIIEPANADQPLRMSSEVAKLYLVREADGSQYIDTKPFERGLMLLNELPGVSASGSFEPGAKADESNFRVKIADGALFGGQAAFSNHGSASTGVEQAIANLTLNNLTGRGDQATLDAIQSFGSSYGQIAYSFPVGYDGWRIGLQGSFLSYQTLPGWSATQTQGTATTIGANATYPLLREQGNSSNFRLNLENRNYSNNQSDLNISQYQITSLSAGINGNFSDSASSVINYSATVTFGNLNISNSTQAAQDIAGPNTAGGYQKLSFNFSRNQELTVLPNTTWLISAYGQLANANLNSSEQIYMGGPYGVRSLPVAQGGGSQGVIFSSELQHRFDENWQLGAFIDIGFVEQYVNLYSAWQGLTNANNGYEVAALGPSVKYVYDKWTVNAIAAFSLGPNPLYNSSGLPLNTDNASRNVQAWVRATYAF